MTASSSAPSTTPTPARGELVPRLRFPEFEGSGEWEVRKLGEVCRIRTGKKDANQGSSNGRYPFFTCAREHIYSETYSFDTEAILIAGNANTGAATYYKGKFEAYQRTYVLSDFKNVHTPYLFAILDARLQDDLKSQSQTSAMSYIRLPMLNTYSVSSPSTLPEQQKIADCLSSLDDLIAAESEKLEALKLHKKGLMQELFPREGETVPRIRFPEFEGSGEWEVRRLGEVAYLKSGYAFKSSSYSDNGKYQIVTIANVQDGNLTLDSAKKIEEIPKDIQKHQILSDRDILISMTGNVGRTCRVKGKDLLLNQRVGKLVPRDIFGDFFYQFTQRDRFRNDMGFRAAGGAQGNLSSGAITDYICAFPSLPEQQKIASVLTPLDHRITAQAERIETLKEHKKGLMQQLFPVMEG